MRFTLNSCDYECSSLIQEFEHPTKTSKEFTQDVNSIINKIIPQLVKDYKQPLDLVIDKTELNYDDLNSISKVSWDGMAPYIIEELEKLSYIKIKQAEIEGSYNLWYYDIERNDRFDVDKCISLENLELIYDHNEKVNEISEIAFNNFQKLMENE